MERRLAAILAADVVGYTRLMGADEAGTLRRMTDLREKVLDPIISQHHGRIVKLMGDGLLVEFASAVDSVACAVAWQSGVALHQAKNDASTILQFRIGINLGDVIVKEGDIHGDGVNIAARLEGLALPAGICLSGDVYRHARGKVEVNFEDIGAQDLKNVAEPVRVYRIVPDGSAVAAPAGSASLAPPNKPSIAVLAFDNMSGDSEQDYFSDGITEDIITELSRFRTLFVIARNSSFAYKGKSVDVKQVAGELGVRYILEGSVRRAGNRIRVTAQLIDSQSGNHVWAERYDRELNDIFALQEEMTRNVVGSIAPQIEMAEMSRIHSEPTSSFSSYDMALKAQALFYDAMRMGNQEIARQAIETADAALEQDPRNTTALWIKAFACAEAYLYRWTSQPGSLLKQAVEAADQLLEIDSSDPRAYTARGFAQHFQGKHEAAVADYRYAFSLNPNFALNIFIMAWCESLSGHTHEAREHAALGLRLSPRDNEITLGIAYLALAQASFADGDYNETEKWAKLAVQMHPKAPIRRSLMMACCVHQGDLQAAREHQDFLASFSPDFVPSLLRGDVTLFSNPEHNASLVEALRKATPT